MKKKSTLCEATILDDIVLSFPDFNFCKVFTCFSIGILFCFFFRF